MTKLLVCLVVVLLFFAQVSAVFAAQNFQFPQETPGDVQGALAATVPVRFLPGNPLYFLIFIKEEIQKFFQPSAVERSEFDLVLSGKRLKETYLLIEKGKYENASNNLIRYAKQDDTVVDQIEKARSQNQTIVPATAKMADDLRFHEQLLIGVYQAWPKNASGNNFDSNFSQAINSFKKLVLEIDNLNPGIKNRFEIIKEDEASRSLEINPSPTPNSRPLEATPAYNPRRIIY